jgi:hypothetical protein
LKGLTCIASIRQRSSNAPTWEPHISKDKSFPDHLNIVYNLYLGTAVSTVIRAVVCKPYEKIIRDMQ